jgi:DNA-binding MarR family transcriptional regulator
VKPELKRLIKESRLDPTCCVLRHVTRTSRLIVAAFDAALAPSGVTARQFTVLVALVHGGPMNVNSLAGAVGMHPSTTPRMIAPLTRRRLVRIQEGSDRRERLIAITAKGNRLLLRAYPLWAQVQRGILQDLGPDTWQGMMRSLGAIRTSLTKRARIGMHFEASIRSRSTRRMNAFI